MRKLLFGTLAVIGLTVVPSAVEAVPIEGTLRLTGDVVVTNTGLIDWLDRDGIGGQGTGEALIGTSDGYFAALNPGLQWALEQDLQEGIPATARDEDGFLVTPMEGFETFPGTSLPGLNFTLQRILPCEDQTANLAQCAAGLQSPFRFDQSAEGTTVFLAMSGIVTDSNNPGEVSTWTGLWDATFVGDTIAELLGRLDADGEILATYSAAKISVAPDNPVPEPASLLLLGTGLVGLAGRAHRKLRKRD